MSNRIYDIFMKYLNTNVRGPDKDEPIVESKETDNKKSD